MVATSKAVQKAETKVPKAETKVPKAVPKQRDSQPIQGQKACRREMGRPSGLALEEDRREASSSSELSTTTEEWELFRKAGGASSNR